MIPRVIEAGKEVLYVILFIGTVCATRTSVKMVSLIVA